MFELLRWKKEEWDFVGKRRVAFAASGALVALGLAAVGAIMTRKAPLAIEFSGGLAIQAALEERPSLDSVRAAFSARGAGDAQIQPVGAAAGLKLLIKLRQAEMSGTVGADATRAMVEEILASVGGGKPVTIEGVQAVGPAVGRELQRKAAWACAWAVVLIMLYIWVRFEGRFGVAAAIATAHDVLAVLGLMTAMGHEFSLLTVTALLTLAGYSLTDTVVVYDRIRENLRLHPGDAFETNINRSINEVLSRTIITSLTVTMPLVAILVYGSPVTYHLALAMLLGMVVGSYSSWYVAAPILVEWEHYRRRRAAEAAAARFGGPRR